MSALAKTRLGKRLKSLRIRSSLSAPNAWMSCATISGIASLDFHDTN
jgi:hypothetical protein